MYFLIRAKYPANKFTEVNGVWNKQPKPSPFAKSLGTFNRLDQVNGVESYTVFDVQNEKISDWYQSVSRAMSPFLGITGYELQIDIVSKSTTPTG